jgi:regulator of protease activity HflC (stomatin/prohibitin superfamily)
MFTYSNEDDFFVGKLITHIVILLVLITLVMASVFRVPEGHVGIVTRWSKAHHQEGPGLQFKNPISEKVKLIEIRERRSMETLAAATKNQLPATVDIAFNWKISAETAFDLYIKFGSLEQFESRILDPRLRQAAKSAIPLYNADELIRDRQGAATEIFDIMVVLVSDYDVSISPPQIENISLPGSYMEAILKKERSREESVQEQYNLDKQKLVAQQEVQSAEAERDAAFVRADGESYRITTVATAEAAAIREVESALSNNPLYIEYIQASRWNGILPSTILGSDTSMLMSLGK